MVLIRRIISEPRGLDKLVLNNQEFAPGKYSHGDLTAFATMVGTLWNRVVPLLEQSNASKRLLQDLQNLALLCELLCKLSRYIRSSIYICRVKPRQNKRSYPVGYEHGWTRILIRPSNLTPLVQSTLRIRLDSERRSRYAMFIYGRSPD